MAVTKPYLTTNTLVESVQRRISFPLSQNTFQYSDIVAFANEELMLSAVPSIKEAHEEYFIYKKLSPLVNGISRYSIPDRAMGMALRDVMWSDQQGNYNKMVRIAPEDKAYFQQNVGANQAISKYYLEGNEVVLTPQIVSAATGNLNFFIFLRPNNLVRDDRACIIQNYVKYLTINDYTAIAYGDNVSIEIGNETPTPTEYIFTAVQNISGSIASFTQIDAGTQVVFSVPHGITNTNRNIPVVISGVTGGTNLNGSYGATVIDASTILLTSLVFTGTPVGGNFTVTNGFVPITSNTVTASNLNTAISSAISSENAVSVPTTNVVNFSYYDITTTFSLTLASTTSILVDNTYLYINFNQLPTTLQNPETLKTENLYSVNSIVDFLQTNPGHRTYTYDIKLRGINSTVGKFLISDLQTYLNNSSGGQLNFYPIQIGDYICLQNECIIPQIPPELHTALAERTASRVLMAIGDKDGLAISQQKIAEMDKQKNTLIGSRVEGSVPRVFNEFSPLRNGKRSAWRRV